VSFPKVKTIGSSVFYGCSSLTSAVFPQCTSIGYYAFANCISLSSVSFPEATIIGGNAFQGCTSLTTVSLTCASVDGQAFQQCSALTTATISAADGRLILQSSVFGMCTSLRMVSLTDCVSIGTSTFQSCYNLISLYLMGSTMTRFAFGTMYEFQSTPIGGYSDVAGQYGSIYVPMSLLSAYQNQLGAISSRIVGI